jgi:hypothetical protein
MIKAYALRGLIALSLMNPCMASDEERDSKRSKTESLVIQPAEAPQPMMIEEEIVTLNPQVKRVPQDSLFLALNERSIKHMILSNLTPTERAISRRVCMEFKGLIDHMEETFPWAGQVKAAKSFDARLSAYFKTTPNPEWHTRLLGLKITYGQHQWEIQPNILFYNSRIAITPEGKTVNVEYGTSVMLEVMFERYNDENYQEVETAHYRTRRRIEGAEEKVESQQFVIPILKEPGRLGANPEALRFEFSRNMGEDEKNPQPQEPYFVCWPMERYP